MIVLALLSRTWSYYAETVHFTNLSCSIQIWTKTGSKTDSTWKGSVGIFVIEDYIQKASHYWELSCQMEQLGRWYAKALKSMQDGG